MGQLGPLGHCDISLIKWPTPGFGIVGTVGTIGTGFPMGNGLRDRSYGGGRTVAIDRLLSVYQGDANVVAGAGWQAWQEG